MGAISEVRGELATRISLKNALEQYTINGFVVGESYIPYQSLETFDNQFPNGKLYVIGLTKEQSSNKSRTNLTLEEVSVMVGYQRRIADIADTDLLDSLVDLVEELFDTARKDFDLAGYSWLRNEPLKDDNGTPYAYTGLRDIGFFEAYFTAFYNHPKA